MAADRAEAATSKGAHRVKCPACAATAIIRGVVGATNDPQLEDGVVVVRQTILPTKFRCFACGLRLQSTAALGIEKLANPFTRVLKYSPLDYYADDEEADEDEGFEYNNE